MRVWLRWKSGDHGGGAAHFDEALRLQRALIAAPGGLHDHGPVFIRWIDWPVQAMLSQDDNYLVENRDYTQEALVYARDLGEPSIVAQTLVHAGLARWKSGDHGGGAAHFDEALRLRRALIGAPGGLHHGRCSFGDRLAGSGDAVRTTTTWWRIAIRPRRRWLRSGSGGAVDRGETWFMRLWLGGSLVIMVVAKRISMRLCALSPPPLAPLFAAQARCTTMGRCSFGGSTGRFRRCCPGRQLTGGESRLDSGGVGLRSESG